MKKRVVFMGSPDFAVPSLEALAASDEYEVTLVVTQTDKPQGRLDGFESQRIVSPDCVQMHGYFLLLSPGH